MANGVFFFFCLLHTMSECISMCEQTKQQLVIIMPLGKCSNENELLKWEAIQLCISICVWCKCGACTYHHARKIVSRFFSHKIEY